MLILNKYIFITLLLYNNVYAQKTALVCGAGGFIGSHLVNRLKEEGFFVRGVDIKYPEYSKSGADEFIITDLRDPIATNSALFLSQEKGFDEVYQLAANMGGMGFIAFHDAEIMHDSVLINVNIIEACRVHRAEKIFFSSSACVYPERNQLDPKNPNCEECSAYPAAPDTEYGWEKLFSERLYFAYAKDYGMTVRVARFHNVFGPEGTWQGGREKAPAAIARKIAMAKDCDSVEIWGDGNQTRSFLYIDECLDGIRLMMNDPRKDLPVLNIGSDEMISINDLLLMTAEIANKKITINNIKGPQGVRGRNSDNKLIKKTLNWAPSRSLREGMRKTYNWVSQQVESKKRN